MCRCRVSCPLRAMMDDSSDAWLASLDKLAWRDQRRVLGTDAAPEVAESGGGGTNWTVWQDNPAGFVEGGLGESLWSAQREVCDALAAPNARVVVSSCHNAGKTHLAARVVAWWMMTWPVGTATAITIANHWRQVTGQIWPAVRQVHRTHRLPGRCLRTEWQLGDLDRPSAWGMSPSDYDVDALSGFHAPHMLVVVDEAGSLSPVLGQSLLSALSGEDGRVLVIGNPSFDDDASPWMEDRTEQWPTIRIPADATPNFTDEATPLCRVHPDQLPHPISDHLVTREWVSEVIATEGQASAYYTARVRAEFPRDAGGRAIPRSWLDPAATPADGSAVQAGPVALGVDIAAGGGDHFAIAETLAAASTPTEIRCGSKSTP